MCKPSFNCKDFKLAPTSSFAAAESSLGWEWKENLGSGINFHEDPVV